MSWLNNTCDHRDADNKYGFVIGPTAGVGSQVNVVGNTVRCPYPSTNGTPANACHPIYLDTATATAVRIERNFTDSGEVGISLTAAAAAAFTTRARISSNIVIRAFDRGVWTDGNVDNIDIWNNIVSGTGQEALYIGKSGAALNVNNNSLINSASGLFYITAPTTRGFNSYYGNTTNVDENGTPGSTTAGDVTGAPLFVGGPSPDSPEGFRLRATSPLVRAGTPVSAGMNDYDGYNFEALPSIGAFRGPTPRIDIAVPNPTTAQVLRAVGNTLVRGDQNTVQ